MKFRIVVILIASVCIASDLFAQPGLPGDPAQAPIDGGLVIAAIAGGIYGAKKLIDRYKEH
ncbi:MAG: hypothetical protein FH748_08975 [Balneolaceae bacterium]|nr:hypothetical protein [Balneolaceae bacterium]